MIDILLDFDRMENRDLSDVSLAVVMNELGHIRQQGEQTKDAMDKLASNTAMAFDRIEAKMEKMEDKYATKAEVDAAIQLIKNDITPTKNAVNAAIGLIVLTVFGALIALVLK